MIKNSFAVMIPRQKGVHNDVFILGVTSIMPNMNGVLFQCENYFVGKHLDHYQMFDVDGSKFLEKIHISYPTQDEIGRTIAYCKTHAETSELIDGRSIRGNVRVETPIFSEEINEYGSFDRIGTKVEYV